MADFPCEGCGALVPEWMRFHHPPEGCGRYTTPDPRFEKPRTKDPDGRPANIVRASRFWGEPPYRAPAPGPVPGKPWPLEEEVRRGSTELLLALGYCVSDLEQGHRPESGSRVRLGVPDMYVTHSGLMVRAWIEFKRWDGEPTAEQIEWGEEELAAGGSYLLVYESAQLVAWHELVRRRSLNRNP